MNLLVYDDRHAIAHVVRAALSGRRHRVSISSAATDARLKLETGLFDSVIIGPGGAPRELADYIEAEWPAMPLVLAGMAYAIPVGGPIFAVLPAPLRIDDLASAVRKLENKEAEDRRKLYDMPIDVIAGERRVACRVVLAGRDSLLLERLGEEPVELRGCSDIRLSRFAETADAAVAFADHSGSGLKYLGVRIELDQAQRLLDAADPEPPLEPAVAEFPAAAAMTESDPLDLEIEPEPGSN